MIFKYAFGIVGTLWVITALPLLLLWFAANDNPWEHLPFSGWENPIQRVFAAMVYLPPLVMIALFLIKQPRKGLTEDGSS